MQRISGVMEEGDFDDDIDIGVGLPNLNLTIPSLEELRVHVRAVTQPVLETGEVGGAFGEVGEAFGEGGAFTLYSLQEPENKEEVPHVEEHVPTLAHTEATAPASSSPGSVDTRDQSNTRQKNSKNPNENSDFVMEMHSRKFTPALVPQLADGVVNVPPSTSPMVQQQNTSNESNRIPSVSHNVKEPNADRQTR